MPFDAAASTQSKQPPGWLLEHFGPADADGIKLDVKSWPPLLISLSDDGKILTEEVK